MIGYGYKIHLVLWKPTQKLSYTPLTANDADNRFESSFQSGIDKQTMKFKTKINFFFNLKVPNYI